jgi:hypothetical protein
MKILVTGIGVSGKSSFRRLLFEKLQAAGCPVEHFDADGFKELRAETDRTCLDSLPEAFAPNIFYIIEDVHATTPERVLPLSEYDIIFYVQPNFINYLLFWTGRIVSWFKSGKFSWEKKSGWQGSGSHRDLKNIWPILKQFSRHMIKRNGWLKEDRKMVRSFNFYLVRSILKDGQIRFAIKL